MAQSNGKSTTGITELEQQFKLPKGWFDKECTDEHILEIAQNIINCWELLAPHLRLTKTEIEDIKKDKPKDSLQRRAALNKWKEKFAFEATYTQLLLALLSIDRKDLACKVCKLVVSGVEAKVDYLQELLDEVHALIISNPEALDKAKGLNLATHLSGVANNIKNIYDVKHDVDQSSSPMELNTKKETVAKISTPVADKFVDTAPKLVSTSPQSVTVVDAAPKLESKPVLVPNISQENTATSLKSRKRRRESAQNNVKNLKRATQHSCGIGYKSDEAEKQYSDEIRQKLKKELGLEYNIQMFHHMVRATFHRFECDHCNVCETFDTIGQAE